MAAEPGGAGRRLLVGVLVLGAAVLMLVSGWAALGPTRTGPEKAGYAVCVVAGLAAAAWIHRRLRAVERGDRDEPWRRLPRRRWSGAVVPALMLLVGVLSLTPARAYVRAFVGALVTVGGVDAVHRTVRPPREQTGGS